MKRMLGILVYSVATGFFAATAVLGTVPSATAVRVCRPCPIQGGIEQQCTNGPCEGGADSTDGSADCQYACCYGAGNRLCGSSDSLDIRRLDEDRAPRP